ncbi:CidB/LrgB family autolysis modulator [Spirosoma sp. HMF4905]|uniref:CidB/LrgB family autolysis modulator n=1 Tax=Spirosoma arboris TaxID=2682092 RepID=A0A7K1SJB3_9BACT|nr:LrgB family protein [Spirosoma arboris]MVM33818.1 CidB/LrgB family autolysis modulator [Spirosoma arboris]
MTPIATQFKSLFSGELASLLLVLATFWFGIYLNKRFKLPLLQPILVSLTLVVLFLNFSGISYATFFAQSHLLTFMVGPSVVALGYVLFEQIENFKGHIGSILLSVLVGCIVAIVSVVLTAKALEADSVLLASLAPKSATMPIAVQLSKNAGGVPELTIAFLVLSGLYGGLIGPSILRLAGVKSKLAIGLSLGAASHAIGTARALELGAIEGAASGLAIGIMGILTALVLPLLERLLY